MPEGVVSARGQVTLPDEIREAAGVQPGDRVSFRVTDRGTVEVRILSRLRLEDALARYRIVDLVNEPADRTLWQADAARDVMETWRA